jgi:flagellar biosynthesis protein FlhF
VKIRQYTAPTMQEAILKIKVDLGPDAVILHTRKFKRGGFLGFFSQDMVEVLAAMDPPEGKPGAAAIKETAWATAGSKSAPSPWESHTHKASSRQEEAPASFDRFYKPTPQLGDRPENVVLGPLAPSSEFPTMRASTVATAPAVRWNELEALAAQPEAPVVAPVVEEPAPESPQAFIPPAENTALVEEVQDLKSTVSDLKAMMASVIGHLEVQPRATLLFPTLLQKVYDRLIACDMDASIAKGLVTYLQKEQGHLDTYEALVDALETPVSGLFQVGGPLCPRPGEQKIVALVGPTGVGKTTTIAKLAATFALGRQVKLALLTIDTYRVAAIEQLKTYGDIIGQPVEVALTPQGVKDAFKRHADKDLILIDTAGRSPHNRMHLNELRSFLDAKPQIETHLVLSATTRLSDLKQIVRNFSSTGIERLIFTKTDETAVVGGIISIAHETGLPVSYITTGQSVPDDLLVADARPLSRLLIEELKG